MYMQAENNFLKWTMTFGWRKDGAKEGKIFLLGTPYSISDQSHRGAWRFTVRCLNGAKCVLAKWSVAPELLVMTPVWKCVTIISTSIQLWEGSEEEYAQYNGTCYHFPNLSPFSTPSLFSPLSHSHFSNCQELRWRGSPRSSPTSLLTARPLESDWPGWWTLQV